MTIEGLRDYLRDESVEAFEAVAGLRLKLWIADPERNRWGAVLLFESAEAAARPLPSRAGQLIGKAPDVHASFDLEASIEDLTAAGSLSRLGLAFA